MYKTSDNSSRNSIWTPPKNYSYQEICKISDSLLSSPEIPLQAREDVFRIEAVGLEWDLGVKIYEPVDPERIAVGADGKKVGVFLLHGGDGDFKSMDSIARIYAGRFGYKTVSMSYPGRLFLDDPARDWPGDTVNADGTVRTPQWKLGEYITADQYEVRRDASMRLRYGTRTVAKAKPGTNFYYRMAGWPVAFEDGMKEAMRRHFPVDEYSIYVTGHSTGGPYVFMISQRVANIAGVLAVENSPFGVIQEQQHHWSGALGKIEGYDRVSTTPHRRTDPFDELYIRTWRDCARYAGPEALGREGPSALMRLPSLIEEVFDWWAEERRRPQFKAEYLVTHNIQDSLAAGARVTAERLGLDEGDTHALVERYCGYPRPQSHSGARPVPPVLFAIAKDSRDHNIDVYNEVVIPAFARLDPAPRTHVAQFDAGTHFYTRAEPGLPLSIGPAVGKLYNDAIMAGYFLREN